MQSGDGAPNPEKSAWTSFLVEVTHECLENEPSFKYEDFIQKIICQPIEQHFPSEMDSIFNY